MVAGDVGCGEGADAVWLAGQGWQVTAFDVAESALERGRAAAESVGIPFAALTTDRDVAARWFDLEGYRPRVAKALRHHRTQLTVHDDDRTITHSGGQADTIVTSTGLRGDVPHLP